MNENVVFFPIVIRRPNTVLFDQFALLCHSFPWSTLSLCWHYYFRWLFYSNYGSKNWVLHQWSHNHLSLFTLFVSIYLLVFLSLCLSFYESIFVSISLFLSISTIRFNVKYEYKYGTPSIGTTKCPKNCFLSFQVFRFISKLGSLITSWRGTNFQRFTKFMERNFWRCHSQQVWTERTFLPK